MEGSFSEILRGSLYSNIYNEKDFEEQKEEKEKIENLIQNTIQYAESNSALIIGPKGSGKTTIVDYVLDEITSKKSFAENSILVKLNGLIHTNDNLALRSITQQMNLMNVVEGKVFGSFAENFAFLLASLKSGKKDTTKSVIFVLDEFDLFCSHNNQTLLYNLFDISQSAQTAVCVLGITCRLDVIELLEKRIKSRFSHRQIFVFSNSYNAENDILKAKLHTLGKLLSIPESKKDITSSYIKNWNKHIQSLLKDKRLKCIIQRMIDIDISNASLKNCLTFVVSKCRSDDYFINISDFEEWMNIYETDDTVRTLQDLNVLELCLIISMKHHSEIYNYQPMNFEMILSRYMKFASTHSSMQKVPRPVIMKAFEHLQNLELISYVSTGGGKLQKEYQLFKLVATPDQIAEAVKSFPYLPTEVVQWASSSLI